VPPPFAPTHSWVCPIWRWSHGRFSSPGATIFDSAHVTVWGSTTGNDAGDPTNVFVPKFVVIALPAAVDVTDFAVDPTAGCGDGGSASTGDFRIETSPNGTTWTQAASGTFTLDDRGRLNTVTPTAGTQGVRFVRFTILGNQTPDFATSCPDAMSRAR